MPKTIYDPIEVDSDYFITHESEQNELYAKIKAVPESVSVILFWEDTPEMIEKICQSFQLNDKQSGDLSRLIRKILVAETYLGDIVSEITNKLPVGQNIAKDIANKVINDLFAPALEDIKKLHIEKFPGKQFNQPSTPIVPPKPTPTTENKNVNPNNVLDLRKSS